MPKQLEFIYDVVSTPCYLAWTQLPAIIEETGADLLFTPVLCGGIFKATGNDGPLGLPAKYKWYKSDLALWAEHLGVPMVFSDLLPFNTLPMMRGTFVAEERGELDTYLNALFKASFVEVRNLNEADEIGAVLRSAGLDSSAYKKGIQRADIKEKLIRNTEDAVTRGVFGVPTFFVGDRMFFGQDRLSFVREALS